MLNNQDAAPARTGSETSQKCPAPSDDEAAAPVVKLEVTPIPLPDVHSQQAVVHHSVNHHFLGAALTAAVWRASPLNAPPHQSRVAGDKPSRSAKNPKTNIVCKHSLPPHTSPFWAEPILATCALGSSVYAPSTSTRQRDSFYESDDTKVLKASIHRQQYCMLATLTTPFCPQGSKTPGPNGWCSEDWRPGIDPHQRGLPWTDSYQPADWLEENEFDPDFTGDQVFKVQCDKIRLERRARPAMAWLEPKRARELRAESYVYPRGEPVLEEPPPCDPLPKGSVRAVRRADRSAQRAAQLKARQGTHPSPWVSTTHVPTPPHSEGVRPILLRQVEAQSAFVEEALSSHARSATDSSASAGREGLSG